MSIKEFKQAYNRFKINYRTETGGINLYPQFDYDLNKIMEWVEGELDWSPAVIDCSWRPAVGDDNEEHM